MARRARDMTKCNFWLPNTQITAMRKLADIRGTTGAEIVRTALRKYLKDELSNERSADQ